MIAPELRENLLNFLEKSDQFFFKKMPTVKIIEGGFIETDMEEYNIYEAYETLNGG